MNSCLQTFGSNKYDLNRLSNFTLYGNDSQSKYFLTPCSFSKSSPCYDHTFPNAMSCQYDRQFKSWYGMAFLDTKSPWSRNNNATYQENPSGPGTGIVMQTSNGEICFDELRFMTTTYICDRTVLHPTTMTVVQLAQCRFTAEVRAIQACPLE
ncbi:hypothetical protein I4U23_016751 [Adineta vaga]|nr:hypothetical protein I4U23_016751 [Adineta vaga]